MFLDHGNKLIIKLLVDGLLLISEAFRLEFQLPKDSTSPPSLQVSFPPFRFVVEMRVDHLFRNLDSRNIQLHLSGQEIARIDGCWSRPATGLATIMRPDSTCLMKTTRLVFWGPFRIIPIVPGLIDFLSLWECSLPLRGIGISPIGIFLANNFVVFTIIFFAIFFNFLLDIGNNLPSSARNLSMISH